MIGFKARALDGLRACSNFSLISSLVKIDLNQILRVSARGVGIGPHSKSSDPLGPRPSTWPPSSCPIWTGVLDRGEEPYWEALQIVWVHSTPC